MVKAQELIQDPNSLAPLLFLHPILQCKVGGRQGSGRGPGPHGNAYTDENGMREAKTRENHISIYFCPEASPALRTSEPLIGPLGRRP